MRIIIINKIIVKHNEVVMMVAKLFRMLRIDAIVEPTLTFIDAAEDACNQRPDIFLRHVAEQNNLQFIPAVFSHTGQIHPEFKALVTEQIRHKLIDFEGEAKSSNIRAVMKWRSRCIYVAVAETSLSK